MKKFVFASVMALASLSLVSAPTLRAQDSDTISIKDPAEFNAYQMFTTQTDPKAKAAAGESFLQTYPQSIVKKAVLDLLMVTYQGLGDADKTLGAASRLLQVDPANTKAIFISVFIKKSQCAKTSDAQTCDDAAALAQKGLAVPKPAKESDDDWKKETSATYPIFHSAIALDDINSKKDIKAGIAEYRAELMLYPPEQTQSGPGMVDTLQLAEAYVKPGGKDLIQAVWFYARAWNFFPAAYKTPIEQKLEYYYKKYHGALDGLDDIKTQAAATVFPPGTLTIKPAATPAERIHQIVTETPDLNKLALADKELILSLGTKDDAEKLWALLKDKETPVPGIVIEATASVLKIAVTQDAKDAKTPDFIVNLKTPLADKDIPAVGFEFKLQPATELDGTYDTYTQEVAAPAAAADAAAAAPADASAQAPAAAAPADAAAAAPAAAATPQPAQIVLKDGFIQPEKKKTVPAHKPAAGHHPAAH
jgi:hypothetical protein